MSFRACLLLLFNAVHVSSSSTVYPKVVVSSVATEVERFAAQELERYLGNMSESLTAAATSDVSFPDQDEAVIAVGYQASIALGLAPSELKGLSNDSFVLSSNRSGIPKGSWVISGGAHPDSLQRVTDDLTLIPATKVSTLLEAPCSGSTSFCGC